MKITSTIFSLLFSTAIYATPANIACITEPYTTTFIAKTYGDRIDFKLYHHNGVKWMPIWSNIVVPNDLPVLNDAGLTLGELGSELSFSMPENSCQADGMMVNCFATVEPVIINGHKVSMWAFHTKEVTEKSFTGEYKYIYTSMALDIDGKSYYVPMKYADSDCFEASNAQELNEHLKYKKLFLK